MVESVKDVISKSVDAYKKSVRTDWVQAWPGQVVLCVSQIFWTAEVHSVLRKKSVSATRTYHTGLTVCSNIIVIFR